MKILVSSPYSSTGWLVKVKKAWRTNCSTRSSTSTWKSHSSTNYAQSNNSDTSSSRDTKWLEMSLDTGLWYNRKRRAVRTFAIVWTSCLKIIEIKSKRWLMKNSTRPVTLSSPILLKKTKTRGKNSRDYTMVRLSHTVTNLIDKIEKLRWLRHLPVLNSKLTLNVCSSLRGRELIWDGMHRNTRKRKKILSLQSRMEQKEVTRICLNLRKVWDFILTMSR